MVERFEENGINYKYDEEKKYWQVLRCKRNAENINIRAEIDGIPVKSILPCAFLDCGKLKSISIPDTITLIGGSAFGSCHSLQSIAIPNSVTFIGEAAFSNCIALQTISLPDEMTEIEKDTFWGCKALENIKFPKNLTTINAFAFANCIALQNVIIPDTVTKIKDGAFHDCDQIKNIILGKSVSEVAFNAFDGLKSLETMVVAEDNPYLCTDFQNIIYKKDMSEMVSLPIISEKTLFLPNNLSSLNLTACQKIAKKFSEVVIAANPALDKNSMTLLCDCMQKVGKTVKREHSYDIVI